MKTRREFFRTLAGSMAVLAACVIVPKSLMLREEKLPVVTSGYSHIEERLNNIDSWITTTGTNEGISLVTRPHTAPWTTYIGA